MQSVTFATFAGHFTFAEGKGLPPLVGVSGWGSSVTSAGPTPPAPSLWEPTSDGTAVAVSGPCPGSKSDRRLALEWIQFIAERVLPSYGLQFQGEVWYQGEECLDTGRLYADAAGHIARQTIKLCPGIAGIAACNDVVGLQKLPVEDVRAKDGFGRTAVMLAALFNSWAVLQLLLQLPHGIDWSEEQTSQNDYIGRTAMHYLCSNPPTAAATQQYAQTIQMLPETMPASIVNGAHGQAPTPLTLAVKSRNMPMLQWLLSHGAHPDAYSPDGHTSAPITAAVSLKDAAYFKVLLASGASTHCWDIFYKSPLRHALELQHAEHLRLLVMYGANLDAYHMQFRHGGSYSQTIRHIINDVPSGTSGALMRTAMLEGIAARRHFIVLTLRAHVAPDLPPEILQLICQHASLTP